MPHRHPKEMSSKRYLTVTNLLLACILVFVLTYSVIFAIGPSYLGDDIAYAWFAHGVNTGTFVQTSGDILSVRILQIYPIAFFYWIMGVSPLSGAMWDIMAFLGTIIVVFFLGRELWDERVGLLAALLFAFFPTVVRLSITMSDNPPMMFFASLGILALLYARRYNSKRWYFICGLSLVTSALVMPEGLMAIGIAVLYLIVDVLRKKEYEADEVRIGYIIAGAAVVIIIVMLFGYLTTKNPFITFSTVLNFYQTPGSTGFSPENANLGFYITTMFPYQITGTIAANIARLNLNPVSIWGQINTINYNTVGFYFYFLVIAVAYLAYVRDKRAYMPAFWLIVGFLIMEFDPYHIALSPFTYMLQHRLDRYLTLIAPPTVLLIAMAIVALVDGARAGKWYIYMVISAVVVVFLIATAVQVNLLWYSIMRYEGYGQIRIAQYLGMLPNTTRIYYTSGQLVPIYMRFSNTSRMHIYDEIYNCSKIPGASFVTLPEYIQVYNLSYTPSPHADCPSWVLVNTTVLTGVSTPIFNAGAPQQVKLYFVPPGT